MANEFTNNIKALIVQAQARQAELLLSNRGGDAENNQRLTMLNKQIMEWKAMIQDETGMTVDGQNVSFEFDTEAFT